MMEDPKTISPSLELLLVSRNLERVADLATNVAEDAVYLAEGKTIKHRMEDRQRAGGERHAGPNGLGGPVSPDPEKSR
jgi:phosphate transport system protein